MLHDAMQLYIVKGEWRVMNTLVIVLIAAVCLIAAYALYGRWLAKKWGIDPKAKTPAVLHNDGQDYVPTDGWTVFAHQFSSIAGAGPVTGAIQAAAFGWLTGTSGTGQSCLPNRPPCSSDWRLDCTARTWRK